MEVLLTDQSPSGNYNRLVRSLAIELAPEVIKIRRLSVMVVYYDDEEDAKTERVYKKVYMIIDGEKTYIDPEIVKKYDLDKQEVSGFTGRKLYVEED